MALFFVVGWIFMRGASSGMRGALTDIVVSTAGFGDG
jgi:hypothetical protein